MLDIAEASFVIALHKRDLSLLEQIKDYFYGEGSRINHGKDSSQYVVSSIKQITDKVLPHFDQLVVNN